MSVLRLASFISGSGTTMQTIASACSNGPLRNKVKLVLVVASRECGGIKRANQYKIPVVIIKKREGNFGRELLNQLQIKKVEAISQNGWLTKTPKNVIEVYANRIFNQHPAPLDFGGCGMYGLAPHAALLKFQELTGRIFPTEATIHHVIFQYDQGPTVHRLEVPVYKNDTPEVLQQRVLPFEYSAQIAFWKLYAENGGHVPVLIRARPLVFAKENMLLQKAKEYAREKYPKG